METGRMRRIDARVGAPMAAALTVHRRLRRRAVPDAPPHDVLVVKLAEQGATVVAVPALRRLVDLFGAEHVHVMVFEENRFILDELRLVPEANVLAVRSGNVAVLALDLARALRRLRRIGVDAALDFEFFSRISAILSYLSGAGRRVGYHGWWGEASYRGDLHTHRLSLNPQQHAGDAYWSFVDALLADPASLPAIDGTPAELGDVPRAVLDPADTQRSAALLAEVSGPCDGPVLLVNANAGDMIPQRRWAPDRYARLVTRLLAESPDLRVLLTGGPSEAAATAGLEAAVGSDRCRSVAGRTTMKELLALYELADVLVTNDSGPAHYAELTGIEVVTLFGPESPAVFGSRSPRHTAVWAGLPCSPCVNAFNDRQTACTDNVCMRSIGVDQVADAIAAAMARRPQRSLR